MKLKTVVAAVLAGALAPFARGAVTITSPADYETVTVMPSVMRDFRSTFATGKKWSLVSSSTLGSAQRVEWQNAFRASPSAVTLAWSGTGSTECTVKVYRVKDGKEVLSTTSTSGSASFPDAEIGRNYRWTVTYNSTTATGHFYVNRLAPRIMNAFSGIGNSRDLGGWMTDSGKVVKQGLVFRSEEWDFVNQETGLYNADSTPKPYWADTLGINLDIDLRAKVWVNSYYMPAKDSRAALNKSPLDLDKNIPRFHSEDAGTSVGAFPGATGFNAGGKVSGDSTVYTADQFKRAIAYAVHQFGNRSNYPILFHCSQGKDRTGALAYLLSGLLGVSEDDRDLDFVFTYAWDAGDYQLSKWDMDAIRDTVNACSGATFKDKCVTYVKNCYAKTTSPKLSATDADNDIATFRSLMLEDAETAAVNPVGPTPDEDTFVYTDYYWMRGKNGSALADNTASDPGHYSWYTDSTRKTKWQITDCTNNYNAAVYIWSNAACPSNYPATGEFHIGKLVTHNEAPPFGTCGIGNSPKGYFTNSGHSVTDRALWTHQCGVAGAEKFRMTLEGSGLGHVDIWANARLNLSAFKTNTDNIYLNFPSGNCDGATVCFYDLNNIDEQKASHFGWFAGGQAGTTQHLIVSNALLSVTSTSKASGVAGKLALSFVLGDNNTTASVAMMKVTKTLTVNSGSTLSVDAGQKAVGTYKLLSAGTLTCDASLYENASVTGLKSGTTGAVVKSGNQINLVIANASGKTVVTVPAISATSTTYTGAVQKPTFSPSSSNYTVNYGSGDYKAVDTYTITLTLVNTTSYVWGDGTTEAKTYSYEIREAGTDPDPGPTPDTKAVTYTWKGGTAQWAAAASWTPGTGATFGYPNHKTYATADFPATLTAATTCTLANNAAVSKALFNSPNLTLVIDNATLTVANRLGDAYYSVYNFGNSATGDQKLVFKGANPGLDETPEDWIVNLGYVPGGASGSCTLRFEVPASNWAQAPLRTAAKSPIKFSSNVRFEIDATALGVPATSVTVPLAVAQGGFRFGDDLESILSRSQLSFASGAQGAVSISGNDLVLTVTGGGPVHPEPEPTPSAKFDADHTIVCYGDSLTWGAAATEITMDDRENFFEGRLAGVAEVPQSYPYWLSGLIPSDYNVISQARSGSQTCNITSWSGEQAVIVEKPFTLPAVGSVSVATNFVFQNPQGWGKWGGWAGTGETPEKQIDTFNRWAGFVTPIFPLYEPYGEAKTRYSITGTLGGRHVRLQGLHPTNITVTVFGEGTEKTVAAGDEFIPDNERIEPYKNAIRIICTGANDATDDTIGDRYATHIKPLLQAFAAKGGKYLIVSPEVNTGSASGTNPTAIEQDMASTFGEHYLNLRLKMVTEGKATADALGVPFTGTWTATNGTGLKGDPIHFNSKGYKVMAEFIRQKLVELGYVTSEEPHVHSWSEWTVLTDATKTADGRATRTCAGCNVVEERVLPKLWDYLETDSSGYLGTGYVPNLMKTEVAFDVRFPDGTSTSGGNALCCANAYVAHLFGERTAWPADYENALNLSLDPTKLDYYNCPRLVDPTAACGPAIPAITDTESRHAISFCGNRAVVDGATYTGEKAATDVAASSSLMLFAAKQNIQSQTNYGKMRKFVYGVTIKENGVLVRSYRPALDANGKATLFDDVTKTYAPAFAADGFKAVNESVTPDPDRALKVLAIGNSFSKSLTYESGLAEIAQNLGKKLDFFNLYYGGCSLQQHWEHHDKVNFYQQFNDNFVTTPNGVSGLAPETASLDDVLAAEPWDIVTLQQNSANSGDGDTYEPYFGNLLNLIRTKAPTAKIWIHQTWSRQGDKLETSKKTYADYDEMYDDICANYQAMATKYGIDTIIPVGYAVQLARHEQNYDPLSSDNQHLRTPAGSYMQACVWAAKLFGLDVTAVTRKPSSVDATTAAMLRAVAQKAAVATDLTNYGATADRKCAAYVWKGGNGQWEQAANWTPDAYGTYGIPHAKTAQAVFPASLTEPTVCTVAEDHTVSNLVFDSANLTLRLDDAKLTVVDSLHDGTYGAYNFGLSGAGDTKLVIAGANAGLIATHEGVRASIGSQTEGSTGVCTVRFEVPATGWETEAPLQTPSRDSNVRFKSNVRFEIDATALGVPAEGETNAVTLAYGTDYVHFDGAAGTSEAENFAALVERSSFVFASGATGELLLDGKYLKLLVTKSSTPGPVPTEVTTNAMANASWGYEIRGLGTAGNEVALVYTNASETMAWTPDRDMTDVRFLVVAGGGGGGAFTAGGGGGGGGVVTGYIHAVTASDPIAITVGAGGTGGLANGNKGTVGGDSTLGAYVTAYGGGYGAGKAAGGTGGSGGGGSGSTSYTYKGGAAKAAVIDSVAVTAVGFGCNGGTNNTATATDGAGGGGALAPGKTPTAKNPGAGGEGLASDISGESVVYGSGGGGGSNNTYCNSNAGKGGTNAGNGVRNKTVDNRDAVANCGGGGGGGGYNSGANAGGNGGSGVVVIRYALGSAEDPIPEEIKTGKSGDVITVPAGATVDVSDPTKLVVNGKEYAVKDHYVFVAKEAGVVLEIAPDEAVIADISIAADGTVTVTSDKAFELFRYALESADNLGFENATTTAFQALDASKTLSVNKDGETRFYRLVVRD